MPTTLEVSEGKIIFTDGGIFVRCKNKDLPTIFREIFKLVPKGTKLIDVKKAITNKIAILML